MRSLQDFAATSPTPIFPDATSLPSFFDHNLVQSTRVVKLFESDVQANIRVFYYQYLKLCFEAEDCDYEQYIRKIEDIINDPNFSFVFDESDDPAVFNDLQFKQLIMEFFGLLGNGNENIETCLNNFPIMDTVFVYFFRSILILTNSTDGLHSYIEKMALFNLLVGHFNIEINVHENCIRFPQTDIFVYEERPEQVYMAYIEGEPDSELPVSREYISYENSEETIAPPQSKQEIKTSQAQTPQKVVHKAQEGNSNVEGVTIIKDSYIEEEFVDYTFKGPALNSLVQPNKMKESGNQQKEAKKTGGFYPKKEMKADPPKAEEPKKVQVPQYKSVKSDYQSDYSSKSQSNAVNTNQNPLLAKIDSNKAIDKKIDQFSYTNPNTWDAKQDINIGSKTASIPVQPYSTTYQANSYPTQLQKPAKPSSNFLPSSVSNQFPPKSQPYSKIQIKKPPSYQPPPQSSFQIKKPSSFTPPPSSSLPSTSKNPCGLNVSDEFTNSFTMKLMSQPSRSTVSGIRQRARHFRNSLRTFLQ